MPSHTAKVRVVDLGESERPLVDIGIEPIELDSETILNRPSDAPFHTGGAFRIQAAVHGADLAVCVGDGAVSHGGDACQHEDANFGGDFHKRLQ